MPEVVLAVLSAIGSTVASVVTFARVIFDIKNTRTDVKTCLDLVQRVDQDIQYAISLRTKNLKLLSENPDELRRIDGIIGAATDSIMDVGRLLEGCRPEAHGGRVPFRGKVKWVLGDSTAFLRRTGNLQQQHAAINIEIAYMRKLGPLKASADPVTNTIFENTELLWMERKRNPSKVSVLDEIEQLQPPPSYSRPMYKRASMPEIVRSFEGASATGHNRLGSSSEASSSNAPKGSPLKVEVVGDDLLEGDSDEDPEMAFFKSVKMKEDERASTSKRRDRTAVTASRDLDFRTHIMTINNS